MTTANVQPSTVDVPPEVYKQLGALIDSHRPAAAYRYGDDWLREIRPVRPSEARFWCMMAAAARMTGLKGGYERSEAFMKACPDYSPDEHKPQKVHDGVFCNLLVRIRDLW